jgi:hypothetical protein
MPEGKDSHMSVPFEMVGWALQWHAQTYGGGPAQNLTPPRYSPDFKTVREIVYDEWVHYAFHLLVKRTNPNFRLYANGALLPLDGGDPVYMDIDNPDSVVKPKSATIELSPAPGYSPTNDVHKIILLWPQKIKDYHTYNTTQKFQFQVGWKSQSVPNTDPNQMTNLPPISIFISDVIPKTG